jgi:hypothetical protein
MKNSYPINVLAYYDFSDETNYQIDVSGKNNNIEDLKVDKGQEPIIININENRDYRQNSIHIINNNSIVTNKEELYYLSLLNLVQQIKSYSNFTLSGWFFSSYSDNKQTIFSLTNKNDKNIVVKLEIYKYNLIFNINNGISEIKINYENLLLNSWNHFVINIGENGNYLYLNGNKIDNYELGNNEDSLSINELNINTFNFGCCEYIFDNNTIYEDCLLDCFLADIIIFNNKIENELIQDLYKNNYGYDIYVLMGQNNMLGHALINNKIDNPDRDDLINGKVFQFPFDINWEDGNTIIEARNPLDHITTIEGGQNGEKDGKMGLWKTFAENMLTKLSFRRKMLLVPLSKSGTSFSRNNWNKGDPIYEASIKTINKSINTHSLNKLVGILWHQGESDIYNDNYLEDLTNMYNNLKIDIINYDSGIKFVLGEIKMGGLVELENKSKIFNNNLRKFVNIQNNTFLVKTFETEKLFDGSLHFDSSSLRNIGIKYAECFDKNYIPNSETVLDDDTFSDISDIDELELLNSDDEDNEIITFSSFQDLLVKKIKLA